MKRFPWISMRKKTAPELPYEPPIWLHGKSNGEAWFPQTPRMRKIRKMALEMCAKNADRIGMDRREFLASAMGMTTTLWVIQYAAGCSGDSTGSGKDNISGGGTGGGYCMPPEAMYEQACANAVIGGNQFIFDVQTHWFFKEDLANFSAYQTAFGGLFDIANEDNYINWMFCDSDTSMVCLTSWPGISCTSTRRVGCGYPLSNERMAASRDKINMLAGKTQRVLNHCQLMPQDPSGIDEQLRIMEEIHCTHGVAAWKLYPGFKPGFRMTDENFDKVVQKGLDMGVNRFCIHKGLPIANFFDVTTNYPDDVGPTAKKYPEAHFIIYHSAINAGSEGNVVEGPFDENDPNPMGVNALIRSLLDNGIGPGSNVYGETGTSFNQLKGDPVQAQHFFGKLMKYLGPDNICWGTDAIVNGGPQPQIEAFRALSISPEFQQMYGYPPLDDTAKAKILGLNSAAVYEVDVDAVRCEVETCPVADMKRHLDEELGPRRWVFNKPLGPTTYEEFLESCEETRKLGRPG